jgi:hypothetical protein
LHLLGQWAMPSVASWPIGKWTSDRFAAQFMHLRARYDLWRMRVFA